VGSGPNCTVFGETEQLLALPAVYIVTEMLPCFETRATERWLASKVEFKFCTCHLDLDQKWILQFSWFQDS